MTGIIETKIFAEFVGIDGALVRREILAVRRNADQPHLKDFGLTLKKARPCCGGRKPNKRSFRSSNAACVTGNAQAASGGAPSMIIGHVPFIHCLASVRFARLDFDLVAVWRRTIRCLQVD